MDKKLAKNVLDVLYDDVPGDVPVKVHIYGYGENRDVVTVEGNAMKCYLNLTDFYDVDELLECRLQYLCYCPADGYLELDFVDLVHKDV